MIKISDVFGLVWIGLGLIGLVSKSYLKVETCNFKIVSIFFFSVCTSSNQLSPLPAGYSRNSEDLHVMKSLICKVLLKYLNILNPKLFSVVFVYIEKNNI
jgi:hypothetical protein